MYSMKELEVVEETKHLVPNLAILAKALFGENLYFIPKAPYQSEWATQDIKIGDGLLWLLDSNQKIVSSVLEYKFTTWL